MTNEQWRKETLGGCSMAAQDCKGNADYAAYNFSKGNEAEAREYVARLEASVCRLKGEIAMLNRANNRVSAKGADTEFQLSAI